MSRLTQWLLVALLASLAAQAWAQGTLTAKVEPNGTIRVSDATGEIAMIELNAHAPGWVYAAQSTATAQGTDLPAGSGKRVSGTLPIPNAKSGLTFVESVKAIPQGLQLEYDVTAAQTVRLAGLQVSVNLPTSRYAGKGLLIGQPDQDPESGTFPTQGSDQSFQVWTGSGERVEVGRGTTDAIALRLRAATDLLVYDLRKWQHDLFEIRFPAIMEDGGRDVTPEDRFHLDFTITFAMPVKIVAP
jgi:hypothetical protein